MMMTKYRETVRCCNGDCDQPIEVEFTEATRKLRITCSSCGQLNQVEIILPSDRGGPANLYGSPENGELRKIIVLPRD